MYVYIYIYVYIYAQCTYLYHVHTCRIRFDRMYNRIQGHTMRGHEPLVTWRRYIYGLDFKRRMRRNPLGSSAGPNHVHILYVPWSNMGIFPGEEMVKKMINIRIFTNNNQDISWDYLGELPIDGWANQFTLRDFSEFPV